MKWVYYDGNNSGHALILPPGEGDDGRADLIVFDGQSGVSSLVRDVPRLPKNAEGGTGHSFRDEK